MKQLLFAMLALPAIANGQTIENTYSKVSGFTTVYLEDIGYRYVFFDTVARAVKFYKTDHSLDKSVNITVPTGYYPSLSCISTKLLNNDSKIEFAYMYGGYNQSTQTSTYNTYLTNEDGQHIMTINGAFSLYPKKVDNNAWKLIAMIWPGYEFQVYGVPGSLPQELGLKKPEPRIGGDTELSPNPMSTTAVLSYSLPAGTHQANLNIYNTAGVLVRQMTVTDQFTNVLIYREDLPPGNYIYEVAGAKSKFVIQ